MIERVMQVLEAIRDQDASVLSISVAKLRVLEKEIATLRADLGAASSVCSTSLESHMDLLAETREKLNKIDYLELQFEKEALEVEVLRDALRASFGRATSLKMVRKKGHFS